MAVSQTILHTSGGKGWGYETKSTIGITMTLNDLLRLDELRNLSATAYIDIDLN